MSMMASPDVIEDAAAILTADGLASGPGAGDIPAAENVGGVLEAAADNVVSGLEVAADNVVSGPGAAAENVVSGLEAVTIPSADDIVLSDYDPGNTFHRRDYYSCNEDGICYEDDSHLH